MIRELDRESDVAAVEKPGFRFVVLIIVLIITTVVIIPIRQVCGHVEQIQSYARTEEERESFAGVERKVHAGFEIEGEHFNFRTRKQTSVVIDTAVADARGENQLRGNGAARGGKVVGVFEGQAAEVDFRIAVAVEHFVRSFQPERVKRLHGDRVRTRRRFDGFGIVRVVVVPVSGVSVVGGALRERSRGGNERERGGAEEFADDVHDMYIF